MSVHFHLLDVPRLRRCARGTRWEIGNKVLYDLCQKYPSHTTEDEIIAKVWLIGRSYSAAIERRRNSVDFKGEDFYAEVVGPKMRRAHIDKWLEPLVHLRQPALENCSRILYAHKKLTEVFRDVSGLEKRSLASKYLHFHFPNLFYIYDSRAARELGKLTTRPAKRPGVTEFDPSYLAHCLRSLDFVTNVHSQYGIGLTPRQLDDYLLGFTR